MQAVRRKSPVFGNASGAAQVARCSDYTARSRPNIKRMSHDDVAGDWGIGDLSRCHRVDTVTGLLAQLRLSCNRVVCAIPLVLLGISLFDVRVDVTRIEIHDSLCIT